MTALDRTAQTGPKKMLASTGASTHDEVLSVDYCLSLRRIFGGPAVICERRPISSRTQKRESEMYKITGVIVAIAIAGPANAADNLADVDNLTATCTSGMENCVDLCTTDDCVDRCEDTARHCLDHLTAAVDCIVMCDDTYDAEQCFPTCLSGMENCADICTPGSGSLDCLD